MENKYKEPVIGDCVNDEHGEYLGRITSIEKGVAKIRMMRNGNLEHWPLEKLFRSHI